MRTHGIVLKKNPYKEYDELVTCYTADAGKQTYQVKSIHRPKSKQRSNLDILHYVNFDVVASKTIPILISAHSFEAFPNIRASLPATAIAYLALEAFDRVVFENEADHSLWQFLVSTLTSLDQASVDMSSSWREIEKKFRIGFVEVLGYPEHMTIEELANAHLRSSRFFEHVLQYA